MRKGYQYDDGLVKLQHQATVASLPSMASSSDPSRSPGDNDFSASRFRKTVCLYDWWLTQAADDSQEKTLAVSGFASPRQQSVQQVVRVFKSAPITKRYDFSTLETADGVCVVVSGLINKSRTTESGFSSEIFNHFVFGFPPDWEDCALKCLEKEAKIVSRRRNKSSNLSTSRGGKRKSEIHEANSIRNAPFFTIKRVTRSGSKSSALSGSRDYCGPDERSSDKCKRDNNANKHDAQLQNDFSPENAKSHLTSLDPDLPNMEVEGTQENHLSAALDESKLYSPQKTGGKRTGNVDEDNSLTNATIVTNRRITRLGSKSVALSSSRDSSGLVRRSSGKYKRDATENKHDAQLPNDFSPQNTESCLSVLESNLLNAEVEGTQDSRRSAAVDEFKVYSPQKTGGKGKGNVNKNTFCGEPIMFKTPTGSQGSSLTSLGSFKRSRSDYRGPDKRSSDKCKRDANENKHDAQLQNDFSPGNAKSHLTRVDPDLRNVEVEGTQENHLSATLDKSKLYSPQKTGGKRIGNVDEDNSLKNATMVTSRRVTRLGSKSVALSSSTDSPSLDRRSSGKYKRDATEYKHDTQLPNGFSPENTKSCLDVMEPNLLNVEAEGTQGSRRSVAFDESKVYSPQKTGGKGKGKVNRNIFSGEPIVFKTPTGPQGSSLTSPDSFKRSRSGRILLPRLEFWRNQVAVYALDRGVAGVQEGPSLILDQGSNSS